MAQEFKHLSVLPEEVIEGLKIDPSGIYVDGTLGGGGHAFLVAGKLSRGGKLIGIDRDAEAIEAATKRLEPFKDRVTVVKGNYENAKQILSDLGIDKVNGILLDLGVSSYQFDNKDRGFSYREDAPLDMRMDRSDVMTAYDVVNTYGENELCRILKDYGEEKFAKNIAARIVKQREAAPIRTTFELTEVIKASIPAKIRETGGHPSKKTFQAIRIEVNRELDILKSVIGDLIDLLAPGGRLCIISFHSLEDRIVKQAFKEAENPCICPPDFPVCVCGRKSRGSVVTRKPVTAGEEELENNQRAHSAKLRIFEKAET